MNKPRGRRSPVEGIPKTIECKQPYTYNINIPAVAVSFLGFKYERIF